MANKVQLTIGADDQASGPLAKVKDSLGGVGEAGKKSSEGTKAAGISLTDLKSGINMAIGAFNAFKDAAEAAFNFAAEGAAINQTKASFEGLGLSIDALRQASNGTVDDMTLMAGSLTLMAGATGEVQAHFADATPQLMEMAKAANKLNPTLGDTSFMFSSIATAAERQSAMIADNLGIVVKQGDAYQKYADSIGVAVTQLTAEQKQIAFLNGLLEAGNTLIEQAGDSTESAADSYAMLTTHVKNMTDATKASVAEAIGPAIGALAQHVQAVDALSNSTEGYKKKQEGLINILMGSSQAVKEYELNQAAAAAGNAAAAQAFNDVGVGAMNATGPVLDLASAQEEAARTAGEAAIGFNDAASRLGEMREEMFVSSQIAVLREEMEKGAISAADFATAQEALLVKSGMLTDAEINAQRAVDNIVGSFVDGGMSANEMADALLNVKGKLDTLESRTIEIGFKWNVPAFPDILPVGGGSANIGGSIEMRAEGGLVASSGLALVGEEGPEFVHLPAGSRVIPADRTRQMQQNGGMGDGGVLINVQATINNGMDAELWANRIAEIAGQRTRSRAMGVV
jgi:hypothetical protein